MRFIFRIIATVFLKHFTVNHVGASDSQTALSAAAHTFVLEWV